jgi:hypothetical protein
MMMMNTARRATLFLTALALLSVHLLVLSPGRSYACTCVPPAAPAEAVTAAALVFAGRVRSVDDPNPGPEISSADLMGVTFDVSQVWKGDATGSVQVRTARDSASCGFTFETNQEYLVYANDANGEPEVSLCSRTTLLANAGDDLAALGAGQPPQAGSAVDDPIPGRAGLIGLAVGLAALLLLGGVTLAIWLNRRRLPR